MSVYLPDTSLVNSKRSSTLVLPYLSPLNAQTLTNNMPATQPGMQGRASTDIGPYLNNNSITINNKATQYPIAFQHLGRSSSTHFTLYASSHATRKPWFERIKLQQEEKNKKSPIFEIIPTVPHHEFVDTNKVNHFITFSKFFFFFFFLYL